MSAKKKTEPKETMPKTQFVKMAIHLLGPDGVVVAYDYGWVSAPKLASIESTEGRMDYLLGLSTVDDENIYFNGGLFVPRENIVDGTFQAIDSVEIFDCSNGRDYFSDKQFAKLLEWNKVYEESLNA